jgi:hypothetical protein
MVSQGRALAVAAGWIVVPHVCAAVALAVWISSSDSDLKGFEQALAVTVLVVLTPLALLAGAVWIARRAARSRSAAVLGTEAGLLGLAVAGLCAALFVATHQ